MQGDGGLLFDQGTALGESPAEMSMKNTLGRGIGKFLDLLKQKQGKRGQSPSRRRAKE